MGFLETILLKLYCLQQREWVNTALRVFIGVNPPPIARPSMHEANTDCGLTEACSLKLGVLD